MVTNDHVDANAKAFHTSPDQDAGADAGASGNGNGNDSDASGTFDAMHVFSDMLHIMSSTNR
jgi:hypothetical protein